MISHTKCKKHFVCIESKETCWIKQSSVIPTRTHRQARSIAYLTHCSAMRLPLLIPGVSNIFNLWAKLILAESQLGKKNSGRFGCPPPEIF